MESMEFPPFNKATMSASISDYHRINNSSEKGRPANHTPSDNSGTVKLMPLDRSAVTCPDAGTGFVIGTEPPRRQL
jgi:hypothetical protein